MLKKGASQNPKIPTCPRLTNSTMVKLDQMIIYVKKGTH